MNFLLETKAISKKEELVAKRKRIEKKKNKSLLNVGKYIPQNAGV